MRANASLSGGTFCGADIEPGVFHGGKVEAGVFHGSDKIPPIIHRVMPPVQPTPPAPAGGVDRDGVLLPPDPPIAA